MQSEFSHINTVMIIPSKWICLTALHSSKPCSSDLPLQLSPPGMPFTAPLLHIQSQLMPLTTIWKATPPRFSTDEPITGSTELRCSSCPSVVDIVVIPPAHTSILCPPIYDNIYRIWERLSPSLFPRVGSMPVGIISSLSTESLIEVI